MIAITRMKQGAHELIAPFLSDPELVETITWQRYLRIDSVDNKNVRRTDDFDITAITGFEIKDVEVQDGVKAQQIVRWFVIDEKDLPEGVTLKDLSRNDKIVRNDKTLDITEYSAAMGFGCAITVGA